MILVYAALLAVSGLVVLYLGLVMLFAGEDDSPATLLAGWAEGGQPVEYDVPTCAPDGSPLPPRWLS